MNHHEESPSISNHHYEVDIVIDRPVKVVWKQFLDMGSWVTSHDFVQITGERGGLGSVMRIALKNAQARGLHPPFYHYSKTIAVFPERRWLLKIYYEKGGSYGVARCTSFDDFQFVRSGEHTRVVCNFFEEFEGGLLDKDPDLIRRSLDASQKGMLLNLQSLKTLLETGTYS